jgi:hypothetical protein
VSAELNETSVGYKATRDKVLIQEIKVGSKVEARYKGKSRYYPGRVRRVCSDGTYDIDYDDGEKETGIDRDLVRQLSSDEVTSPMRLEADSGSVFGDINGGNRELSFREGMKVEARYRGKARYYPGIIGCVNRDGTCDINYNDVR